MAQKTVSKSEIRKAAALKVCGEFSRGDRRLVLAQKIKNGISCPVAVKVNDSAAVEEEAVKIRDEIKTAMNPKKKRDSTPDLPPPESFKPKGK